MIYTDGSKPKDNQSTGASLVLDNKETAYVASLARQCSVFTAEAFAIKMALEYMEQEYVSANIEIKDIIIFSDCQSVLKEITNNILTVYQNKYILEIRKKYCEMTEKFKIKIIIIWIPSHRGLSGNEAVDVLAK